MSRIVVEKVNISKKVNLGQNNFVIKLAPFSKTKSIRPGQFVHIGIPNSNVFFRRAFSVYDIDHEARSIYILFKVFGRGTSLMAKLDKGDELDIVGPLGNGFKIPSRRDHVILAAGGVGMPPIYFLAKSMIEKKFDKEKIFYFYGGASKADLVEMNKIKKLGIKMIPATDDGSFGYKGFVTQAIASSIDLSEKKLRFYACGPEEMLKAVDELAQENNISGQLSFEAPMPCGVGICLGCILPLREGGYTRVCREGPVYNIGEIKL